MSAVMQPEAQGFLDLPGEASIEVMLSAVEVGEKAARRRRREAKEDLHAHEPRFVPAPPDGVQPLFRVTEGRHPLCKNVAAARVKPRPDVELTEKVAALWDEGVQESQELCRRFVALAPYWADRDDEDADPFAVEQQDLTVATAMRMTLGEAARAITDAHRAVELLPRCALALESGEFPAEWFRALLRKTSDFTPAEMVLVDVTVASWCLAITPTVFTKYLKLLVARILWRREKAPEEITASRRHVAVDPANMDGIATLRIVGPAPEIKALAGRFDQAARAVQNAQRHSLKEGTEIPLDPDGRVAAEGMPLSLNMIRYHLAHAAQLDTDGITAPEARFRINVLIPFLTLAGGDDAPGVLDDGTPIPAEMAREIASKSDTWYRVLTDPSSGEFLPRPADRYRPTETMLEHLRLRGQTCGVPGCERSASAASEADHIIEYDHAHPEEGGQTAVENLHFLCWFHHAMKTAGQIDPVRIAADKSPTGRAGTEWHTLERIQVFIEDDTDLLTPQAVAQLDAVWEALQRHQREYEQRLNDYGELRGVESEDPPADPADPADSARWAGSADPPEPGLRNLDSPWPVHTGIPDPWPRVDMDAAGAPDVEEIPVEKPMRFYCGPPPVLMDRRGFPMGPPKLPRPKPWQLPKFDPGPPPF